MTRTPNDLDGHPCYKKDINRTFLNVSLGGECCWVVLVLLSCSTNTKLSETCVPFGPNCSFYYMSDNHGDGEVSSPVGV